MSIVDPSNDNTNIGITNRQIIGYEQVKQKSESYIFKILIKANKIMVVTFLQYPCFEFFYRTKGRNSFSE